ncbi:hypothetical protein BGZ68_002393 [Mortierella alpina]|nr:hypothetical protein BGZ68_002393 [Mortierella alpina]
MERQLIANTSISSNSYLNKPDLYHNAFVPNADRLIPAQQLPALFNTFKVDISDKNTIGSVSSTTKDRSHDLSQKFLSFAQELERSPSPLSDADIKVLISNEIPASEIKNLSIGIDAGGMGIIHFAEWKGIKVAIKEASAQVISKEVEIYSLMQGYEGVVQFYGVTYPPRLNKLCLVTKYAENGSLSWHLKTAFHKLTWSNKLTLATEIASSVAHLHQEGIYHRDLHGGNILIDATGKAMLTDFGASTVIEDRVVRNLDGFAIATVITPAGQSKFVSEMLPGSNACDGEEHDKPDDGGKQVPLIGVMAYIAPERFRKPQHFDARCDIYSLGVLLWELTSGHSAFSKMPQDVQLAVSILNGKREQAVEGTPDLYRELYERCWESDPELRPSLDEILSTLDVVRSRLTEDELAVTRERNSTHGDTDSIFTESVSIPRPTSDCQKYMLSE